MPYSIIRIEATRRKWCELAGSIRRDWFFEKIVPLVATCTARRTGFCSLASPFAAQPRLIITNNKPFVPVRKEKSCLRILISGSSSTSHSAILVYHGLRLGASVNGLCKSVSAVVLRDTCFFASSLRSLCNVSKKQTCRR